MELGACHECASGSNLAFHVDFCSQIHCVRIFCGGQGRAAVTSSERAPNPIAHRRCNVATHSITRTALYARVSTSKNGQSPEMQLRELREYCERRGWNVAGEYIDTGICGAKDRRPELNRLMVDAHKRRFDVVMVWKFDRFARSVSHLLRALETFKALRIDFVSYSEQMDTSTPAGKMVFTVLGAVAELERSLIAERVRAGWRNARAKGKRLARPSKGIDRSTVAALRSQGASWRAIAEKLGVGIGTLYRAVPGRSKTQETGFGTR